VPRAPRDGQLERVARARHAARTATGAWAAKRELAAALRELLAHLPATAAPEDALRATLPLVREAAARFAAAGRAESRGEALPHYPGMEHFHETGPLVGLSNALAPPLALRIDAEARVVRGFGRFGPAYEGAPGILHGGFLAAAFDEILGMATLLSGRAGMTRELRVRYLRPTPIDVDLEFAGRFDRAEGRRISVSGEVLAAGVRTAEASGVFTAVAGEIFEAFDQARRERRARRPP
jgi:acyl-coenzyme A thioesterase PaaI-like protein